MKRMNSDFLPDNAHPSTPSPQAVGGCSSSGVWDEAYRRGSCVRRWPSEDVIRFCAGLPETDVAVDLGTGTGRNLAPLLLSLRSGGVVIALEAARSGLQCVKEWAIGLGAEAMDSRDRSRLEECGLIGVDEPAFSVRVDPDALGLGPGALFRDVSESYAVHLVLREGDMVAPGLPDGQVGAVLNRGNLSYLSETGIRTALAAQMRMLKPGGRALVSAISTEDSRWIAGTDQSDSYWQRTIVSGEQAGLTIELFDRPRFESLLGEWEIRGVWHHIERDLMTDSIIATYTAYVEKPLGADGA